MSYFQKSHLVNETTSTASAGGTTTLVNNSTFFQVITGVTTQTVVLPDATTMSNGFDFNVINESTGVVTVNTNGGSLLTTIPAGQNKQFMLKDNSSSAGVWSVLSGGGGTGTLTVTPVSSNIALLDGHQYDVDTTAARSLTLPSPTSGVRLKIKDVTGTASTNNITLVPASGNIEGLAANYILQADYGAWELFADGTNFWLA